MVRLMELHRHRGVSDSEDRASKPRGGLPQDC
ncbi:hypothetical protein QC761_0083660 [Podospora bellae-mahoneyi]|uniref:Uncharacterized protein n=1 Tax=Podospora bellae-mahoneyi TaxID=2093777 RepID=A0ABR0FHV5_9PEZI|nr:hypothetical protein QC761_0083660 [Podospora bellae-mahoneyi]